LGPKETEPKKKYIPLDLRCSGWFVELSPNRNDFEDSSPEGVR
jgi:hypothetical protein